MAEVKLIVLYPYPPDIDQFNRDYQDHLKLLRKKMQLPDNVQPWTLTRFVETPMGKPVYCQMFTMPFPSAQALLEAFSSPEMQEVSADSVRVSSGGTPVVLVGVEDA